MNENYKMQLKPTSIMNIPLHLYQNDFTFIVNGEEFKTNRIISDLISPKICQYHFTDTTIDSFTIKTVNKGDFSHILKLANFEFFEFPSKEFPFISEVLEILGNNLIDVLYTGEGEELTINNIIDLIRMHENPKFNCLHSLESEIEFASENLSELFEKKEEELTKLDITSLLKIFNNEKLILKDEDQLLSFINHLYSKSEEYLPLYETVIFSNASSKAMNEFIEVINMNDITNSMWIELSNRLKIDLTSSNNEQRKRRSQIRYQDEMVQGIVILHEEGKQFNGIVKYLQSKSSDEIDFSASSVEANHYSPKNVALFDYTWNYFHSKDLENSWICLDFKNHFVIPKAYEIKSYPYAQFDQHPKSWVIEVSNDYSSWSIIDEEKNCSYLNNRNVSHTFKIKYQTLQKFRYIRMRLTGPNFLGKNSLAIGSFELYGTLI